MLLSFFKTFTVVAATAALASFQVYDVSATGLRYSSSWKEDRELQEDPISPAIFPQHPPFTQSIQGEKSFFEPLQELRIVYNNTLCPSDFEPLPGERVLPDLEVQLPANLNAGTNGIPVTICYKRGTGKAIYDVEFYSDSESLPTCPDGWAPVLEESSRTPANLNYGASLRWFYFWTVKRHIVMCYRTDDATGTAPLYQLRILESLLGVPETPREFDEVKSQDLNEDLGGKRLYLAMSRSPSMLAAAIAFSSTTSNVPDFALDWSEAVENFTTGDITVTLRLHLQKDGGQELINLCNDHTDLTESEFKRLKSLAIEGIEDYWSGPVELDGVTRQLIVRVEDTDIEPNKDADICARGSEFGDGTPWGRSSNFAPLVDMVIWYNKGTSPSRDYADTEFYFTSAHEIGHDILWASYGFIHTATHKGTSILGDITEDTPMCPSSGDIDIMKAYRGGDCAFERWTTTNLDRVKVIMTASKYTYSS